MKAEYTVLLSLLLILVCCFGCNHTTPVNPNELGNLPPLLVTLHGPTSHLARPNDTLSYQAGIFQVSTVPVIDSTLINWNTLGRGHWLQAHTISLSGATSNQYVLGVGAGIDTLVVSFGADRDSAVTKKPLSLFVGNPAQIAIFPQSVQLRPGRAGVVRAVVRDSNDIVIQFPPIQWGCTNGAGTISSLGFSTAGDSAIGRLLVNSYASNGTYQFWATTSDTVGDTAAFIVGTTFTKDGTAGNAPLLNHTGLR